MNRSAMLAQAARGPVLLMTVGTLFALQQSGALPLSKTWPLLIIIVGIMKLAERMLLPKVPYPGAPGQAYPYPGPSGVPPYAPRGGGYPPAGASAPGTPPPGGPVQ